MMIIIIIKFFWSLGKGGGVDGGGWSLGRMERIGTIVSEEGTLDIDSSVVKKHLSYR